MKQLLKTLCVLTLLITSAHANAITINGRVSFPETPSYTLTNASFGVRVRADQGLQQFQQTLSISTDTPASGDFSIDVGDVPLSNVQIDLFCFSGCDDAPIMETAFLSDTGSTFYPNTQRTIATVDSDIIDIDFPILEANLVNGTISIEAQESTSASKQFFVFAFLTAESQAQLGFGVASGVPSTEGTIAASESSGTYTLKLPKNSGFSHNISVECINCNISSRFEIGDDGFPKRPNSDEALLTVNDDQSLNSVDLEIPFGNQLRGTIALADSVNISTDVDIEMILTHRVGDSSSFVDSDRTTVSANDSTIPFSLGYLTETEGDFTLSFGCPSSQQDCGNLQELAYFTLDGIAFDESFAPNIGIPFNAMPTTADIVVPVGELVSGQIRIPDDFTFTGSLNFDVNAIRYDASGEKLSQEVLDFRIDDASSPTDFQMALNPLDSGESYEIFAQCEFFCGALSSNRQYIQADGPSSANIARLSTLPSSINFTMPKQRTVSGIVRLPNGELADTDYQISLNLSAYSDINDFSSLQGSSNASITIPVGANSASYEVVVPGNSSSFITFIVGCAFGQVCGRVLSSEYTDTGFQRGTSLLDAVAVSALPELLEVELLLGEILSFTTSLPDGARPSDNTDVNVSLSFDDGSGLFDSFSTNVTIPAGSTRISGELVYASKSEGEFRLRYGCSSLTAPCGRLHQVRYFTPNGIEASFQDASFDATALPTSVSLPIEQGAEFSGTISLPNLQTADGDIGLSITLQALDNNSVTFSRNFARVTIQDGGSSVGYLLGVPADAENYLVSISCSQNCGSLVRTLYATPNGVEFVTEAAILTTSQVVLGIDIELVEGQTFRASIALPKGLNNADVAPFSLSYQVILFDEQGRQFDQSIFGSSATFTDDNTLSDPIHAVVPAIPDGGYAVVFYGCNRFSSNCNQILSTHFYSQTAPELTLDEAQQLDNLSTPLTLNLLQGVDASFQVERPQSQPHSGELVYTEVTISILDDSGMETDRQEIPFISIFENSDESRLFNFPLLDTTGSYRFSFKCTSFPANFPVADCSLFDNDHPNNTFEIDTDSLPNPIRFQYVAAPTPILPDAFEVDNTQATAKTFAGNIVQNRTIHEAGDIDWLSFSLDDNADINIEAQNSGDEGQPKIALLKLRDDDSLETIETRDNSLSDAEINNTLSLINVAQLEAGDYFIKVEGFSPTSLTRAYRLSITGVPDDELCVPIRTGQRIAVICL